MKPDVIIQLESLIANSKIPSLPEVVSKIYDLINQQASFSEIANVTQMEPGLSARVLKIANSAWYQRNRKIGNIEEAISNIGVFNLYQIILATSVCRVFRGISTDTIDMNIFWQQSVHLACTTKTLAEHCNHKNVNNMYTAGLLAYIGRLVLLLNQPEITQDLIKDSRKNMVPLHLVEKRILGFDHSEITVALLKTWNLPESLYMAILNYNQPEQNPTRWQYESALINLGHYSQYTFWTDIQLTDPAGELSQQALKITDIHQSQLPALAKKSYELYQNMITLFN